MRGYFDEEEPEPVKPPKRDTELTLGFGTLTALFFGLVLLCGLCFGLGYEVGRGSSGAPVTLQPSAASKSAASKPSTTPQSAPAAVPAPSATPGDSANLVQQSFGAPAGSVPSASTSQSASASRPQQQVRPALPAASGYVPPPQHAQPAPSASYNSSGQYAVRVAAVPNPDDGEILVNALRRHGYAVTARREADNLIHVRVGPFSSRDDAIRWRQRLLADGYNAILE